jgi:predicted nucleic acid-binding protein
VKPALFLDTSAWFAALHEREQRHVEAAAYYHRVVTDGRYLLVTTNLVLAEMYALLRRRHGSRSAVAFLDRLDQDPSHEVVWVARDLHRRAVDRWLRPFDDQRFSLADAVAFELMRERGVTTAFATDRDFIVAGYQLVP